MALRRKLPTEPGHYWWTEWNTVVTVFARGAHLYVCPPRGVEVRITPRIAGKFADTKPLRDALGGQFDE